MSKGLDEQLLEAKEKLREKNRIEKALSEAKTKLLQEKERFKRLESILRKEKSDVQKLEGLSLTNMFYQVLGSKDQKLNKEKQELIAAKLKYDQCEHSISALEREIVYREKQKKDLGDPDAQYSAILAQKESIILESEGEKLTQFSEKLANLNSETKELKEAIDAGKAVLNRLEKVIAYFKSAGNWGVADLIGGGLIITAVKHSKIDKAKAEVHEVQHLLGRFQRELSDLRFSPESKLGIEVSSFQTFADYIFDGLIFDWIVQSKINKSLNNARNMKDKMQKILDNLQNQLKIKHSQRRATEKEKTNWLENL